MKIDLGFDSGWQTQYTDKNESTPLICPNCKSDEFRCLLVVDFEKGKMYGCVNCGARYNPNDTKETADLSECIKQFGSLIKAAIK